MSTVTALELAWIGGPHGRTDLSEDRFGGKAANLARLERLGLRVPPALALSTDVWHVFSNGGRALDELRDLVARGIHYLETTSSLTFGVDPLLLSVRSSPPVSMPGMLSTVLDVGLSEESVSALIRRTGNPWLAWDAYRRLVRSFAGTVHHLPSEPFEQLAAEAMQRTGARSLQELDPVAMRDLARRSRRELDARAAVPLPLDPLAQVVDAVRAVSTSWDSDKAHEYRRRNHVDDGLGVGVLIQVMVFGDAGPRSGAGVGFTRNPATGEDELYVDFTLNAQGEDIVSGRCAVTDSAALPEVLPDAWRGLVAAKPVLEREFLDMQEFEFTVEERQLYFLQCRAGKRTPAAAIRIAADLVREGVIGVPAALERVGTHDVDSLVRRTVRPRADDVPLASGVPASVGVATGRVAFDAMRAEELSLDGPVILARSELNTDDFAGLAAAAGIVTTFGGRTSHAAVLARQLGKVCLVGCRDLHVDERAREATVGGSRLREGDVITLDGETGWIYAGAVPITTEAPLEAVALVETWRKMQASSPDAPPRAARRPG